MAHAIEPLSQTQPRRCSHCAQYKDLSAFSPKASWCKRCQCEYKRSKYIPRPKRLLRQVRQCTSCGQRKNLDKFSPANSQCKECKAAYKRSKYVPKPRTKPDSCSQPGCNRGGRIVRGLCTKCYQVWWTERNPEAVAASEERRKVKARLSPVIRSSKFCSRCQTDKPISEFGNNIRSADNLASWCLICTREYSRNRWAMRDPMTKKAEARKWNLKAEFDITPDEYDTLFAAQDEKCAICDRSENATSRKMSVDHNHNTGQRRGIICNSCNLGIGMLGDDHDTILAAAAYLLKYTDILRL